MRSRIGGVLEPVYASQFCPSANRPGAALLRFPGTWFASGIAVASLLLESQRELLRNPRFQALPQQGPAKHRIPFRT